MTAVDPRVSERSPETGPARVRDVVAAYVGLMKPRVIELLLLTTVPVMFFAARGVPEVGLVAATVLGGTLSAGSASAFNNVYDRDIDEQMRRTRRRALPRHIVSPRSATVFALVLAVVSTLVLGLWVNWLSAGLALGANAFYVLVYTMYLKRRTAQNIVWGGLAGCFPALIGWTAVTGELAWEPVILFLVVFFWTPPHTWALALRYRDDYAKVDVPMLPVVASAHAVARQVLVYSYVMVAVSLLLWPVAGHRVAVPGRGRGGRCGLPGRGAPDAGPCLAQRQPHRRAADAAVPLVQHVPVAAVRRRRGGPADRAVTGPGLPPGPWVDRPTPADLEAARDRTIPDLLAPGLSVLFSGINPGLWSGATGLHFARPGNRFWPTLHRSGFTPGQLRPQEEWELLGLGLGITNVAARATARADELARDGAGRGR